MHSMPCGCAPGDPLCACLGEESAPEKQVEAAKPHLDHVAFHAEQPMKLYQVAQVKVAMGHVEEATRVAASAPGLGAVTTVQVPHTGELVTARLIPEAGAFEVDPTGDQPLQNIDLDEFPATFSWLVKPIKPGDHYLLIEVSTLRQVQGHDSRTTVPIPNGTQRVHVVVRGVWPRLVYFNESTGPLLKGLLALLPTGGIVALLKWAWSRLRKRPPGGTGSSRPPASEAEEASG